MPFSLFNDLKKTGWHSSIMTTFSVDPAFYDANVQYRLRVIGCQNNLLLADAGMLTQAIEALPEAFVNAGKTYLIQPVSRVGSFHPKISLRYGKGKARLIIGSANVTASGWGRNKEVVSALSWSKFKTDNDNDVAGRIIKKTHNYLIGLLPEIQTETLTYKLKLLHSQSQWLKGMDASTTSEKLNDGTLIDILFGTPNGATSLLQQFADNITENIERLLIISPYWDMGLQALNELQSQIDNCPVHIFMNPGHNPTANIDSTRSTFPVGNLTDNDGIKFYDLTRGKNKHRFLHAKIIIAQSKHHDYVLYGSSNCTRAALGTYQSVGKNEEASFFRRLKRGTLEAQLKLSYDEEIPRKNIATSLVEETANDKQNINFFAGTMDRHRNKIYWNCAENIEPIGAFIKCDGEDYIVNITEHGRPYISLDLMNNTLAIIVKVRLPDGRISAPIIVSSSDELSRAAPSSFNKNLKNKLDKVFSGESDLIGLARDIHLIFDSGRIKRNASQIQPNGKKKISHKLAAGIDFATPEEFRSALALSPTIDRHSLAHADNPALQVILKIILKGIIKFDDMDDLEIERLREEQALKEGEDQDEWVEDKEIHADTNYSAPKNITKQTRKLSATEFEKNKKSLLKVILEFEQSLREYKNSDDVFTIEFVTKSLFVMFIMLYGCSQQYELEDGKNHTLLNFSVSTTKNRDEIFLIQAAKIVKLLWSSDFESSLIYRVEIDRNSGVLPVDMSILIILSRWILASILLEVNQNPLHMKLACILDKQVPEIFKSTTGFVAFDNVDTIDIITGIQKNIGSNKLHRKSVLDEVIRLEIECS